jgi:hypothetical protein
MLVENVISEHKITLLESSVDQSTLLREKEREKKKRMIGK